MIDKNIAKLIRTIKECNKHKKRILYVMGKMRQFMPLTPEKYGNFTENEIEIIDLFIFTISLPKACIDNSFIETVQNFVSV